MTHTTAAASSHPVYFINEDVPDLTGLRAGLPADAEVIILDASRDGISQVKAALAARSDIPAIHVLSHGSEGTLQLGASRLDEATLTERADELGDIGAALAENGDILLYGCDLAAGTAGDGFIDTLALLTGADVAASDDLTGRGGDWDLEHTAGEVETLSLSAFAASNFDGTLALPGARSETTGGEVFLGGDFIELGISSVGSFGTSGSTPAGFFGTSRDSRLGMSNDADGFDTGTDLRIDYFLPGSPEERWAIGYNGSQYGGFSNLTGVRGTATSLTGTSLTDNSSGSNLTATFDTTVNNSLDVTQVHEFSADGKFFKTTVTVTNVTGGVLTDVRYMRSFDPDNTVYKGGSYTTINTVERQYGEAGATSSVVSAESRSDSYSSSAGSTAKILFFSSDPRAYVANFGFSNSNPYAAPEQATGYTTTSDSAIAIVLKAGTLAAGDSATFEYYTSLDTADIDETITAIEAASNPPPTLTTFADAVDTTDEDTQVEVTFAELAAQGDEADQKPNPKDPLEEGDPLLVEGDVIAFVVTNVTAGTLLIGADAGSATPWVPGTNDAIDAGHNAYWTPAADANGEPLTPFTVVARDEDGLSSTPALAVPIDVTAVNDAPVISSAGTAATLPAIDEDQAAIGGATVASLFGPRFSDVDAGASFGGVLVIANAATAGEGSWQYSTDGGSNWFAVGSVSGSAALALNNATLLRFEPASDYNGTPGSLTVRFADDVYSGGYSSGASRAIESDTTPGESGISAETVALETEVTADNDLPTFSSAPGGAGLSETAAYDSTVGAGAVAVASGALSGTLTGTDQEDVTENSGAVTFGIRGGSESGGSVSKAGFFGTLTLNETSGSWSYTPQNFVAINALAEGATATDSFEFKVIDSDGASTTQVLTITYTGTNDIPVLTAALTDQSYQGQGTWSYQLPADAFADAEGLPLDYSVEVVDGSGTVLDTIGASLGGNSSLPSGWLIFDEAERTLTGTPTAAQQSQFPLNLRVTATDSEGATVSDTFELTLEPPTSDPNPAAGNIAPTATDDAVVVAANGADITLGTDDFGAYDDANGDALAAVKITVLPAVGSLELNGTAVTAGQDIAVADITGNLLTYTPGDGPADLTFQVGDGTDFSEASYRLGFDATTSNNGITLAAPTTQGVTASTWAGVYGSDPLAGFDPADTVRIVVEASGGNIRLTDTTGITQILAGYDDATTGTATSIAFEGTQAEVNTALQTLEGNLGVNPELQLEISAILGGAAYNPDNGHYYEVVATTPGSEDWTSARNAAAARTFDGQTGYLATITSAEENAFVLDKLDADAWIGASDAATEGTWQWVTGPETGTTFSIGNDNPVTQSDQYANWNDNEPNDSGGNEDYAQFFASGASAGRWNDLPGTNQPAYIVEYGGTSGDPAPSSASATGTLTLLPPAPVLSLDGDAAYTENAPAKALAPVLAITDADGSTLESATVTLSAGRVTGDALAFDNDNSTTYGNIGASYDSGSGTLTLTSAGATATHAQWENALAAVTFASTSDDPGTSRTVQWQLTDGDGNSSGTRDTTITVTAVNDPPVATPLPDRTFTPGSDISFDVDNTFTDPDGPDGDISYAAEYREAGGSWTTVPNDASYWLSFDPASRQFSGNPPAGLPELDVRVIGTDDNGAGDSSATSFTLNLASAGAGAAAENNDGSISISDDNGDAVALGDTLSATAPDDDDGYDAGDVIYQWQISRDGGSSWSDIDGATASTFTVTQDESSSTLRAQAFYVDDGGFAEEPVSNTLTVPALNVPGTVTISGSRVPGQTLFASLEDRNGITGATPTYTWYRGDSPGDKTTVVGGNFSSYKLVNDDGGKYLTVEVSYSDDEGTAETVSDSTDAAIQLGAVAPVAVNDTGTAEEAGGVDNSVGGSNGTGNVLDNDTDANSGDSRTVTGLRAGGDEGLGDVALPIGGGDLFVGGEYGSLTLNENGGWTYAPNQFNFAVQALNDGDTLTDSFNYVVTDGTGLSDIGVLTVTIEGANDAPSVRDIPIDLHVTEDVRTPLPFPEPFAVEDPDSPTNSFTLTLEVTQGTLTAADEGGIDAGGSGTGTVTLTGTLADLNSYLDGSDIGYLADVQHLNANDATGAVDLYITLEDDDDSSIPPLEIATPASPIAIIIDPVNDLPTGRPSISGTLEEGETVSAVTSPIADADGLGPFSYQWLASDQPIAGATGRTFTLTQAEVGKRLTVDVSYTDEDGTTETVTSLASIVGGNINNPPTGSVQIQGTPQEDQSLRAVNTINDTDGVGRISYQWLRDGEPIPGATGDTFVPGQVDVGTDISVRASYRDFQRNDESVTSSAVTIANRNDLPQGGIELTGLAEEDQGIGYRATVTDEDGLGPFQFQWLRDGDPISGATGGSYFTGDADVGTELSLAVTYVDQWGTTEQLASNAIEIANVNDPPAGAVTISGTATQGETLTAGNTLSDDDGLGPISYQWLRDGAPIPGATGDTLLLTQDDVGSDISVRASYTDGWGTDESVDSTALAVANANDAPEGAVAIAGTPAQGETLTASNTLTDPDGMGPVSYQWLRDGVPIDGATGDTLALTQDDVGSDISVRASYTDGFGTDEQVDSPALTVANVNDPPTGTVTISGDLVEGATLTADNTLDDADGMGPVSYQWLRDGVPIDGATGETLLLTAADIGAELSVRASYTDGGGTDESADSDAVLINNVNDAPTGAVTINGTPTEDETLTAANSLEDLDGLGPISYQWLRDGAPIPGASGETLLLTQDDVGSEISVRASYTDGQGTDESVDSAPVTVANANDAPEGAVTISGDAVEDGTLTASNDLADDDGLGPISYQWLRDDVPIDGATGDTLVLGQDDVGSDISVRASYTDGFGTDEAVTSDPVSVGNLNDPPDGTVTISGTPKAGETLAASNDLTDDDGLGPITYQWLRDGVPIDGATGDTLLLDEADVGADISVRASYTDGQGTEESVDSAALTIDPPDNRDPVFTGPAAFGLDEDTSLDDAVAATDPDSDPVSFALDSGPAHGTLTFADDGSFSYTPDADYNGSDSFTVTASDGRGGSATRTVTLNVAPVDDPLAPDPDAPTSVRTPAGESSTLDLAGLFRNPDGDPLTLNITVGDGGTLPPWLTIDEATGELRISAAPGTSGRAQVTVTATGPDGNPVTQVLSLVAPSVLTVDGMIIEEIAGDGVVDLSVPVVTAERVEDPATDNEPLADIPLFNPFDPAASESQVSLPLGVALEAQRSAAPASAADAAGDLLRYIEETTAAGDADRPGLLAAGQGFLDSLPDAESLLVSRLTLLGDGTVPGEPVRVSSRTEGAVDDDGDTVPEALVIDATGLEPGTVLRLDGIEFAVIVGDAVVEGGDGANIVYGNEGVQEIILGAGDDWLFAGSGDDTVGSAGGDDRLFGQAGDDQLLGGGSGSNVLHGGLDGGDVAVFEGDQADYSIAYRNASVVVSALADPDAEDLVVNAETLRFDDSDVSLSFDPVTETLAWLYGSILDRQADLGGIEYWVDAYEALEEDLGDVALFMLRWPEFTEVNGGVAFDEVTDPAAQAALLYERLLGREGEETGLDYWSGKLAEGVAIEDVVDAFVTSEEMLGNGIGNAGWDFFL